MRELTRIQHEIQETLAKYQSLKTIDTHLDEINKQLAKANSELSTLDKQVNKELADWENLENASIKSVFYKVLGSKEEQIEKERQEYLEISLKYNEYKKSVELMEFEQKLLKGKADDLDATSEKLEELKKGRASEILNSNDIEAKKELEELLHKIDSNRLFLKEIEEALNAGALCHNSLAKILKDLQQAVQWGQWDMMNKRGGVSAHMKYGAIDRANRGVNKAQYELKLFSRELEDINQGHESFGLQIPSFSRFTDFFFDNLISDWVIQQKIKNAFSTISSTADKVKRIHSSLQHEKGLVEDEYLILNNQKENLLTS